MRNRLDSWRRISLALALVLAILAGTTHYAFAQGVPAVLDLSDEVAPVMTSNVPSWMEPRGVNVIDLIGLVPEEHLRGTIISFSVVNGILEYLEGQRYADQVILRVKVHPHFEPSYHTYIDCPAQFGYSDHWSVAMPGGTVRLFQGDVDITDRIIRLNYYPSGLTQPVRSAAGVRYREVTFAPMTYDGTGAMRIPPNQGCAMVLDGYYDQGDLTALFTLHTPQVITARVLGSESFTFGVYRGGGFSGMIRSLQEQLRRFGTRHDKFPLAIPGEADFVLLNYPASAVSPYIVGDISRNIVTPSSGTYRLASDARTLSIDHQITMGLPLYAQYRDADQADGRFLTLLPPVSTLTGLEYFVPEGVPYHPCMQFGGCTDDLLRKIVDAQMNMTLHYYRIEPIAGAGLIRIPLRQVGTQYSASSSSAVEEPAMFASLGLLAESLSDQELGDGLDPVQTYANQLMLPMLGRPDQNGLGGMPVGAQQTCPCGWFTSDGRMVAVSR